MKKCLLCMVLAALVGGPAANAAFDWGFISTAGDPDPVTAFDLADPTNLQQSLGFVDGNFNRGMDFNSLDSFYYYVSTDTLNDPGDRGLWYWDNNTNTQLATIPFSDSGDGDASLSADLGRLFITTDDQDATSGDSLYVFDNLGGAVTFTEIGETGLTQLIGLAVHPITREIYGYDSSTESLYILDENNATPTLVGASGESFAAIGGMDFNADGSLLLLAAAGELYGVDPGTGLTSAMGDVVLNTSALSYRIPEPSSLALLGLAGLLAWRRR